MLTLDRLLEYRSVINCEIARAIEGMIAADKGAVKPFSWYPRSEWAMELIYTRYTGAMIGDKVLRAAQSHEYVMISMGEMSDNDYYQTKWGEVA